MISPAIASEWFHSFYPFRASITVEVPSAGEYALELTPETITDWMNEKAVFKFKADCFDYNNVRLVEIDKNGKMIDDKIAAGYRMVIGKELIQNGSFEKHQDGRPVGWSIDDEAFKLSKTSHDGSWCMTVTGADRRGCYQAVTTDKFTWYQFSYRGKGGPSVAPHITRTGDKWWLSADGSYQDPYIPPSGWYKRSFYFYTSDKSDWTQDALQVRMEHYTGSADDISLRKCSFAFVLKTDKPGAKRYMLYYSPLEGMIPIPPTRMVKMLPKKKLAVTRDGVGEWLDDEIIYSLSSNDLAEIWYASSTRKILEQTPPPSARKKAIKISCARNESEALQIVFRPRDSGEIKSVHANLKGPGGVKFQDNHFDIRRAHYVPIIDPSFAGRRPWRGAFIGRLPDPLPKFEPVKFKTGDPNILIWVDITVPKNAPAGIYQGAITLSTSSGQISIPLALNVWNFTLPDRPSCRTAFQQARYANSYLFPWHKVTEKQDKYDLSRAYVAEMGRYKVSATGPTSSAHWYSGKKTGSPYESLALELPGTIDRLGLTGFTIGHVSGNSLMNVKPEKIKKQIEEYYEPAAEYLSKKGWLKWAYIQIDEPQSHAFPGVRKWIDTFRQYPHAKNIKMFGFVYNSDVWDKMGRHFDIIVPINNDLHDIVSVKGAATLPPGKEVWFYWTGSAHKWIDVPGINQRLQATKTWAFGGKGMSTWNILQWWQESNSHPLDNPWKNPKSPWGNGTLTYFYPPSTKGIDISQKDMTIIPSLRMVLLRDGIEDYEYAVILERLISQAKKRGKNTKSAVAALKMFRSQFDTPVTWRLGETYWREAREKAAQAIVDLNSALIK